jgi:hypothetical protein
VTGGSTTADGGIDVASGGGVSPRSIESSRRVSRSMTRTASHEES